MLIKEFTIYLKKKKEINNLEKKEITKILKKNGVVVINNFFEKDNLNNFVKKAKCCLVEGYNAGFSSASNISTILSSNSTEFRHPFFISKEAVSTVLNKDLNSIISSYLGSKIKIHHALFQKTVPTSKAILDWHIDLGSNKILNGSKKFLDKRLRMIVYLTNVKNGGLNYIVGSHKQTLKQNSNFSDNIKSLIDKNLKYQDKFVEILGNAGTLIFFDTHGLHKPGLLKTERIVFNSWFCRNDFKGKLTPNLVDLGNIKKEERSGLDIFSTTSDFEGIIQKEKKSLFLKMIEKISW